MTSLPDLFITLGAFVLALGILVAVHEFGHFSVARLLGVKVLKFSIGFGRTLLSWQRTPEHTEYALALIPLGGYVKMLDETELEENATIAPEDLSRAFNRQPLWKRAAIVLAGPLANLLLAVLLYWALFVAGETGLRPLVGVVAPDSIADQAGIRAGDELLEINEQTTRSWEDAIFDLTAGIMAGDNLRLRLRDDSGEEHDVFIARETLAPIAEQPDVAQRIGLTPKRPEIPPVIGELVPGEPAEQAGLRIGDRVLGVDGTAVTGWRALVEQVREHPGQALELEIERNDGSHATLTLTPHALEAADGHTIGRIGAGVRVPEGLMDDYEVPIRYSPVEALGRALSKTTEMSTLTLKVMGRILIGEASIRNLSGPIMIADIAGQTARYGLRAFTQFLAVVSISLGVLNLLPIPVLDGGHLLFFLIEGIRGRPVSERVMAVGQSIGIVMLATLMTLAIYVDITRLLG